MKAGISWSAGKDSSLALYKALEKGYRVEHLLNFVSKKHKRCCFHGIPMDLVRLQSKMIGIHLFQKETSPDMKKYEQEFKEAVNVLKKKGIKAMVFGDIYLIDHMNWVKRVCKDLKVKQVEPLWNRSPEKILKEFIDLGFKAIVVSAKSPMFNRDFVGRIIDYDFLEELKKRKICPCGESGEFHTFVIDGPIFKKGSIEITKSRPVLKKGFWPHWFLDIQEWKPKVVETKLKNTWKN
jgi:uncharacterized protein (TIGR00290 family)